jgi:hypothetical protein
VDPATGQLPLVTRGPRKGQPVSDYLKYYQDDQPLDPVIKHAYMAYLPVQEFGPGMKSATEIRTVWPELNDGQKSGLVQVLYPATRKNSKLTQTVKKLLDAGIQPQTNEDYLEEKWSTKYKRSIDCSHPRGFSQRAHCAGRKK